MSMAGDRVDIERIGALLSAKQIGDEVKNGALAEAAQYGDTELVMLLVRKRADPNHRVEESGKTILMVAAAASPFTQCGNDPLPGTYRGHKDVVKSLLEAGARANEQDAEGNTALMLAAQNGRIDSVKLLLEAGANVRLQNKYGWTALIYAANSSGDYDVANLKEIVTGLIEAGADVNACDWEGKTALSYAMKSAAIREILISAGAVK